MSEEFFNSKCWCGAKLRIYPAGVTAFLQTSQYTAACGHSCGLPPDIRVALVNWLTENHPALLYPESVPGSFHVPALDSQSMDVDSEEAWQARLKAKLEDIDNYLARRGKYA